MRRRRKRSGAWLPILGQIWEGNDESYHDSSFSFDTGSVPLGKAAGPVQFGPVPVTKDYTIEPGATTAADVSLRDFVEGQDYVLQRIVGKLHLTVNAPPLIGNATQEWRYIKATAAFFVGKSEDANQNVADYFVNETDPTDVDNVQNPWIWRRTWIFKNPQFYQFNASSGQGLAGGDFPRSNAAYGSVIDGPHIDSKVRRRIHREQRLWFICQAQGWDGELTDVGDGSLANQPNLIGNLDIRLYGAMRKGGRQSAF